jgi:hypothetical protein
VLRQLLPQRDWTLDDLQRWLANTQARNQRAKWSHAKRHRAKNEKPSL